MLLIGKPSICMGHRNNHGKVLVTTRGFYIWEWGERHISGSRKQWKVVVIHSFSSIILSLRYWMLPQKGQKGTNRKPGVVGEYFDVWGWGYEASLFVQCWPVLQSWCNGWPSKWSTSWGYSSEPPKSHHFLSPVCKNQVSFAVTINEDNKPQAGEFLRRFVQKNMVISP